MYDVSRSKKDPAKSFQTNCEIGCCHEQFPSNGTFNNPPLLNISYRRAHFLLIILLN